jgi:hypothetical protein
MVVLPIDLGTVVAIVDCLPLDEQQAATGI